MVIKEIDEKGIVYVDEAGEELFLDLKACNENWLAYRKRTEALSDEEVIALRGQDKTVGHRNASNGDTCFIEFFSRPFMRIEFSKFEKDQFNQWRDAVWESGWTTWDLS